MLNTYSRRYTDAQFIFSIFMSMSRPRSIYFDLLSMCPFFASSASFSLSLITYLVFVHFLEYLQLFLNENVDKENE